MGRKPRGSADFDEKAEKIVRRAMQEQAEANPNRGGLTRTELLAAVCSLFCDGFSVTEIRSQMKERHGITLGREEPYALIGFAAKRGWIHFEPPEEIRLALRLKTLHKWLRSVAVVNTPVVDQVASRTADLLIELIVKHAAQNGEKGEKSEVHLGFSGGVANWLAAKELARKLHHPIAGLPETLVMHALVAGYDSDDPSKDRTTDPNEYFVFFTNPSPVHVKMQFVNLRAPDIIVESKDFEALKKARGTSKAFDAAKKLDIILTSASRWDDDHNMLRRMMTPCSATMAALGAAGPAGDMLWRPFNKKGEIEVATLIRAMTLLDLRHLPRFIERGKDVVLALGPCGGCHTPKGELLRTLVNLETPLFNHLVVDTRAARESGPNGPTDGDQVDAA